MKIIKLLTVSIALVAMGISFGCASGASPAIPTTQLSSVLSSPVLTTIAVGIDISGYNAGRQELLNLYAQGKISGQVWTNVVEPALNQAYADAMNFKANPTGATLQSNLEEDIATLGTIAANYATAIVVPPVGGAAPPVLPPPAVSVPAISVPAVSASSPSAPTAQAGSGS